MALKNNNNTLQPINEYGGSPAREVKADVAGLGGGGDSAQNTGAVAGLGGLGDLTAVPSLDFDVGGRKGDDDGAALGGGAYVPSFGVGGASRRPRRMLGR